MELLSPAGDFDSLKAAVQNGADAIYFGLSGFNARRFANNFSEVGEAVSYAHLRGCKAYLTLNTLLLDKEFPAWTDLATQAALAGIDAFIVQDLGGASVLKNMFPDIPLHASTQMTIHNTPSAKSIQKLGFTRVVLARELTAGQVADISRLSGLETEFFVHGALCVCYSGQCLMSSMLGGRSANRGACAQPCRLQYSMDSKQGYLLSTKDLCLVDELDTLHKAGVCSLKIEGRMKRPEYVAAVTRVYRKALDGGRITQQDKELLLIAFNRGHFTGNLFAGNTRRLYTIQPDNLGLPLGNIVSAKGNEICIDTSRKLNAGDEIAPARPDAQVQRILQAHSNGAMQAITLKNAKAFKKGMPVNLLKDKALFGELAASIQSDQRKTTLRAKFCLQAGSPPVLGLYQNDTLIAQAHGAHPAEPAKTHALAETEVRSQIGKTGGSPFRFDEIDVCLDPGLAYPKSALNGLRRQVLEKASACLLDSRKHVVAKQYSPPKVQRKKNTAHLLAAQVVSLEQAQSVLPYVDILYVPIDAEYISHLPTDAEVTGVFPQITTDEELRYFQPFAARFNTVMAGGLLGIDNLAAADFSMNVMNSHSLEVLCRLGFTRATLSTELNATQINALAVLPGLQAELIVYGRSTLMVTQHCPIDCDRKKCGLQHGPRLKDRKGMEFPLLRAGADCRVAILNSLPLYMADRLHTLRADIFRMVFTVEQPEQCAHTAAHYRKALKDGIIENNLLKEYTRGHFSRGV
ncbi:U32 family peptidase [Christensenellaceae bacterium OttesenSCG-928-K19]|nr:U32 family peptidase [Christensenellaceae bacterium OttesenSCG-928-K19]